MDRVHAIDDDEGGTLADKSDALSAVSGAEVSDGTDAHDRGRRCCDFAGEQQRTYQLERTRDDRASVGGGRRRDRTDGSRWKYDRRQRQCSRNECRLNRPNRCRGLNRHHRFHKLHRLHRRSQ
jgi:hypothetical protein